MGERRVWSCARDASSAACLGPRLAGMLRRMRTPPTSRRLAQVAAAWFLLALVAPSHAALSRDEERLAGSIAQREPAARALLRRAVEQNSGTLHLAGVRAVGDLFAPEFERLGFAVRWVDGAAWGRAGHLIAERRGRTREAVRLLLIGHLDTVFEPDSPFQAWEALGDTAARAPGSTDMKGGNVIMLMALEALRGARTLDRLDVTVVLTGDEEKPGAPIELARADLIEAARDADLALGFEDGDGDPRHAVVARRGSGGWLLRVRGNPSHSSQIHQPTVGEGAILGAARVLGAFRDSLAHETLLTLNPGAIVGGTEARFDWGQSRGTAFGKSNVVAESTIVSGDLRPISREQRERAQDVMRRIAQSGGPGVTASIEFDDSYPPLAPTDGNRHLLALYDAASRDLSLGAVTATDPRNAGAADISFTSGYTPMALDALGLKGSGGHTVNETADLRTLATQAQCVAVMLHRIARAGRAALRAPGR